MLEQHRKEIHINQQECRSTRGHFAPLGFVARPYESTPPAY